MKTQREIYKALNQFKTLMSLETKQEVFLTKQGFLVINGDENNRNLPNFSQPSSWKVKPKTKLLNEDLIFKILRRRDIDKDLAEEVARHIMDDPQELS